MSWLDTIRKKQDTDDRTQQQKEQDDLEVKNLAELPAKTKKIEDDITAIKTQSEKDSQRLNSFLDQQEEAKRKAEAAARAKAATDRNEQEETELNELALTDPVKAAAIIADKKMAPLVAAQINTQSVLLRKQIFDDDPDRYEFYSGDFKNHVDKLINNLPLNLKTEPEAIKNCYAVAMFDKQQEIKEGKIKSRFAAASASAAGTSTKETQKPTLSDAEKHAAKAFGISEDDYSKMKETTVHV